MTVKVTRDVTPDGREAWVVRGYQQVTDLLLDPRLSIQPPDGIVRSWFSDSPVNRVLQRLAAPARTAPAADVSGAASGASASGTAASGTAASGAGAGGVGVGGNGIDERTLRRDSIRRMLDRDRIDRLSPDVQGFADELVADVLADETDRNGTPTDLNDVFSVPLCARVCCAMLGVPADDVAKFRKWAIDKESDDYRRATLTLRDMSRYVTGLMRRAETDPGADIATHLVSLNRMPLTPESCPVTGAPPGDPAPVAEILTWIVGLGWQVSAAALNTGLRLFLGHPEQRRLLTDEPQLLERATEEILRLFDFIPREVGGVDRFATEDMELDGYRIRAGDLIVLDVSAANRDPNVFPDPRHFDIRRTPNHHLTFGRGAYYCNFSRVARQELSVGIRTLLDRLPNLRLADAGTAEQATAPNASAGSMDARPTGALYVTWDRVAAG